MITPETAEAAINGLESARRAGWAAAFAARARVAELEAQQQEVYAAGWRDAVHEAALSYDEAFDHGYRVGYEDGKAGR